MLPVIPENLVGPAAGVAASAFWVLTSIFFTAAGHKIGATAVNTLRLIFAVLFLGSTHLILYGTPVPHITNLTQWGALALSGFIGLTICDQALFSAFLDIGPRRALLLMTSSPIWALIFGTVFLSEHVNRYALLGMGITIAGIVWVVLERQQSTEPKSKHELRGFLLVMVAAISQPLGTMFSKVGMGVSWLPEDQQLSPLSATLVRMVFGLFGMVPIVLVSVQMAKRSGTTREKAHRNLGILFAAAGAFAGPFLGVWLSLVAIKFSPIGVAQTMLSLSPVMILPFVGKLYKERLNAAAILGACVAVGGVALIAFSSDLDKQTGDAPGHPAGQSTPEHRSQSKPGEVASPFGGDGGQPADLNGD